MTVDLETAARTLVIVAMGQTPEMRVTVNLIVAVLSRKFPNVPDVQIYKIVNSMIIEEGGEMDELAMNPRPEAVQEPAGIIPTLSTCLKYN